MTVSTTGTVAESLCNGVSVTFPVPFQYAAPGDLVVEVIDAGGGVTVLSEGAHYFRTGEGMSAPSSITTTVAYPTGARLRRRRDTRLDQQLDLVPNVGAPAEAQERALDRQVLAQQELTAELQDVSSRSTLYPVGEVAPDLPAPAVRRGTVRVFDPVTGLEVLKPIGSFPAGPTGAANSTYTTLADLQAAKVTNRSYIFAPEGGSEQGVPAGTFTFRTDAAPYTPDGVTVIALDQVEPAIGALVRQGVDGLTFQQVGLGAMARSAQDKARDGISVKDFGTIGDGTLHTVQEWIVPFALGRFPSFAALRAKYPHVTSLGDSIDWAGAQAAYNHAKSIVIPQEDTGGYGALQKGGAKVSWPGGVFVMGDKPLEFAMNTGTSGAGPQTTLIKSNANGPIVRNDPVPVGPGGYNREGSDIRGIGIVGNGVSPLQIGLSLLRWSRSRMDSVAISNCGGDAWLMRECSCNNISNVRVALNKGIGLRMRVGLIGGWGTAENDLPNNANRFTDCSFIENGSHGTSLENGVNGNTFEDCLWEYNDGAVPGNGGIQFVVYADSYVPNVVNRGWMEGANLLTHILVASLNAQLDLNGLRHFALGTKVSRAIIATGGVVTVRDGRSPQSAYPNINGSTAPFRIDPAGARIIVDNHMGAGVSGIGLVEKMNGSQTGLFSALVQTGRDGYYGPVKIFADAGSVEALGFYRDDDTINAWAMFDPFRKSLTFADTGITRTGSHELSLAAPDGGASFFNHGSSWNGNHLRLGTYDLWIDATGKLRIKNGLPTGDTDGAVVGAQG